MLCVVIFVCEDAPPCHGFKLRVYCKEVNRLKKNYEKTQIEGLQAMKTDFPKTGCWKVESIE